MKEVVLDSRAWPKGRIPAPPCEKCQRETFLLVLGEGGEPPEEAKTCMDCLRVPFVPLIRFVWRADYWDPKTQKLYVLVSEEGAAP